MEDTALKLVSDPPVAVMSLTTKLVVASLEVNVIDSVASLEVPPSETSAAWIVIVGAVPSYVHE